MCDAKRKRTQEKTRVWGVGKVYMEYENRLADPEIDLVELLVPSHLVTVLRDSGHPVLDSFTGKAVFQFTLAALVSAREGREVRPDDVR